jgi:hypothetical protein
MVWRVAVVRTGWEVPGGQGGCGWGTDVDCWLHGCPLRAHGRSGVITQKQVREIVDAARGASPNVDVWGLTATAWIAIAEPLAPLPRSQPQEQVE